MKSNGADPFDNLDALAALPPVKEKRVVITPQKPPRREQQFAKFPMAWRARLRGASGQTVLLAIDLAFLSWQQNGGPIELANVRLNHDGISRFGKWRALNWLEALGIVNVERRPGRSPLVHVLLHT